MGPLLLLGALAATQDTDGFAVVLASSPTSLDAAVVQKLWSRAAGERLAAQPGYPRIVPAEEIPGTEPGSTVALAGICPKKAQAELIRDILRLSVDGVRVLPVDGQAAACPELQPGKPAPAKDAQRIKRRALLRGSAVAWELVSDGMTVITGDDKRYPDLRVRVWAGKALLDELMFVDAFDPQAGQPGVGSGVTHRPDFVEVGDRSVLWIEHEKRAPERISSHAEIIGFFDGKLRSFREIKPYLVVSGNRKDWRAITLTVPGDKRGERLHFVDRERRYCALDECVEPPDPTLDPIEMPGCSDVTCACVARLKKPVALHEKPSRRSPVVGSLAPGQKLEDAGLVSVVAKRGLARIRGKRVTYLGSFPASDGETFLVLVGDRTKEVAADDIENILFEPVVEEWARLARKGISGYTDDLDAIVRGEHDMDGTCVKRNE